MALALVQCPIDERRPRGTSTLSGTYKTSLVPAKPIARIHDEVVGLAVAVGLGYGEAHVGNGVQKGDFNNFSAPLVIAHKRLLGTGVWP